MKKLWFREASTKTLLQELAETKLIKESLTTETNIGEKPRRFDRDSKGTAQTSRICPPRKRKWSSTHGSSLQELLASEEIINPNKIWRDKRKVEAKTLEVES